ncbi:5282_t:CDS:2 [Acaulospora morrowiae]|uniref:Autophagy-related protein 101 n=1 Tax=Acaulospora morrowiae TaxID=94023 RepID=A0A9N8ZMC3_9GLOM|nr:5282_t:CDS:2 [Acaulospora morrowiae]
MAPEVFSIDLTIDRDFVAEVLRAILHTILFYRVFGNIRPKEVDLLDITYSAIDDPEIEKAVEDKVEQFKSNLENNGSHKGQIAVMFHEKRTKKAWFSKSEEEICWEQWAVTITTTICPTDRERLRIRKEMDRQLSSCLFDIIRFVNDKKDHIPPITTSDENPFPYQIVIPTASDSWGSMLKRMLTDSSQPI